MSCEAGSSVGVRIVPVGVNELPATVPLQMPTVSTAAAGGRPAPGTVVLTVNDHGPAAKSLAPPTGSTIQPFPDGVVGSDASALVVVAPGAKTYQPPSVALLTETVWVFESGVLTVVPSFQLPDTALGALWSRSGLG